MNAAVGEPVEDWLRRHLDDPADVPGMVGWMEERFPAQDPVCATGEPADARGAVRWVRCRTCHDVVARRLPVMARHTWAHRVVRVAARVAGCAMLAGDPAGGRGRR